MPAQLTTSNFPALILSIWNTKVHLEPLWLKTHIRFSWVFEIQKQVRSLPPPSGPLPPSLCLTVCISGWNCRTSTYASLYVPFFFAKSEHPFTFCREDRRPERLQQINLKKIKIPGPIVRLVRDISLFHGNHRIPVFESQFKSDKKN